MLPADWNDIFSQAGEQYGVDPEMLRAQVQTESGGNPNAVSSSGARGPAQFMPATAKALGITDPTDPTQSIYGMAQLMRQNLDRYGDPTTALMAYHGGTNQSNWGPLTQAYPDKVRAAMNTPIAQAPLDASDYYFDPTMNAYVHKTMGTAIPATLGQNPGQSFGTNGSPADDSSPAAVSPAPDPAQAPDPTQAQPSPGLPSFGGSRFNTPFSLGGPQDQNSILQDPNYKDAAILKLAGGMASGTPALAGLGAGLTGVGDVALQRTQNSVAMQRLEAMYGPKGMQVASSLIRTGMQPSSAFAAAGIQLPPALAKQLDASSQFGKPLTPGQNKIEQTNLDGIGDQREFQIGTQHFRDLISQGKLNLDPLSRAKYMWQNSGVPGSAPTEESRNYLQFKAFMEGARQTIQNDQKGATSDQRSDEAMAALTGGGSLNTNEQAAAHLDYLGNQSALAEKRLHGRIDTGRVSQRQPTFPWDTYEQALPPSPYAGKSAQEIGSNAFGSNGQSVETKPSAGPVYTTKSGRTITLIGK